MTVRAIDRAASAGYSGTPTKLSGVAYRRSMIASGTTARTSVSPAARAASDTGGTAGGAAEAMAQDAVHTAAKTAITTCRTRVSSRRSSIVVANDPLRLDAEQPHSGRDAATCVTYSTSC